MQTLVQKLNSMENMIQSTNVTCSMSQFALLKSIQPWITNSIPWIWALPELQTPTAPQYNFNIPVFNQQKNNNISPELQATSASLSVITRTTDLANPNIQDIFTIIKATELSPAEQAQGLINLLYNTPITLSTIKIENWILTLWLSGTTSLSSAQFGLIQAILEETYKQFPEISSVFIQQDS